MKDSGIKKPSLKGESCCEYLGHFKQDKYIQAGHNDVVGDMFSFGMAGPFEKFSRANQMKQNMQNQAFSAVRKKLFK